MLANKTQRHNHASQTISSTSFLCCKKTNLRICKKNGKNFSNVIVYLDQWTSDCSICQFDFSWRHFVFNQRAEVEESRVKLVITSLQQPLLMLSLITSPSRLLISRQILRQDQFKEEEKTRGLKFSCPSFIYLILWWMDWFGPDSDVASPSATDCRIFSFVPFLNFWDVDPDFVDAGF